MTDFNSIQRETINLWRQSKGYGIMEMPDDKAVSIMLQEMEASGVVYAGFEGLVKVDSVFNTSQILLPHSTDIVNITKINDSIIIPDNICIPYVVREERSPTCIPENFPVKNEV